MAPGDTSGAAAPAAPYRVLCLGYSVTEQPGYVERANALAAAEGRPLVFLRSGWGAHSLCTVACLIDEILDAFPCDFVLLELFTGSVRYFRPPAMRAYLDEILAATARRGLPVAFLNLHQGGVDYDHEPCAGLVAEYRRLYAIPRLDIAAVVAAAEPTGIGHLLKDGTHVTAAGGDLYGTLVYAFLCPPPARLDYVARFAGLPRRHLSLPLRAMPGLACPFELRRNGLPLHFLEIPGGARAAVDLGRPRRVVGVLVAYGPPAGTLTFTDPDGGRSRSMLAYDEYCYYTRSAFRFLTFRAARRLTIAQGEAVPEIALRKGETDRGPRLGRVSHVFCRAELSLAERWALLRHALVRSVRRAGRRWR
ncbi:hypothetical protein Q8W71_12255 [Methylobacterium sp. NEAU 140]|uniref:hypothetical protein n=1 Tax=Methylobacterium sp. NEAU 140 TaxID=3064945 RepID=UPI0027344D84|nr:hypothetical protein [Methylobacterium sp. NEAU 140]MDP4023402.1 hypothetical protein [Methylobacterium sp. NEAU 140]